MNLAQKTQNGRTMQPRTIAIERVQDSNANAYVKSVWHDVGSTYKHGIITEQVGFDGISCPD